VNGAAVGGRRGVRDTAPMSTATGFTFEARKSGEVVIRHRGRVAATLRGRKAVAFLEEVTADGDLQARMARVTGQHRHGNERQLFKTAH
jgi:hypothetical protein